MSVSCLMSIGYSVVPFIKYSTQQTSFEYRHFCQNEIYAFLKKLMFYKIMNLITEFMGKSRIEAEYSKPTQLCNRNTNSTNINTSVVERMC